MKRTTYLIIIILLNFVAYSDCIDESQISNESNCYEMYAPVCGCDGLTYVNDCYAENAGVTDWTDGECQPMDSISIEGRWRIGEFDNTMYEFFDGFRYTYYCADENGCDSTYWSSLDTSNAIPNPNPYVISGNTISINLFFGTIATYEINIRCDGQVLDFYYDEDDDWEGLHSTLVKIGYNSTNIDCEEQIADSTSIEGRWLWSNGGISSTPSTMYEFLNDLRYIYYCDNTLCDLAYWNSLDTSNAIPNPDSYTFINNMITIGEEDNGSLVNFKCNGNIALFGDNTDSYIWRVGLDINDCDDFNNQQLGLLKNKIIPQKFILHQNYPNPFNPITNIQYQLFEDSYVNVTVYDMLGNLVNNLVDRNQISGFKSVQWNGTNNQGEFVSAGVYLFKIHSGEYGKTKKMVLLK